MLHKRAKNHDHVAYCFWDMACDGFPYKNKDAEDPFTI